MARRSFPFVSLLITLGMVAAQGSAYAEGGGPKTSFELLLAKKQELRRIREAKGTGLDLEAGSQRVGFPAQAGFSEDPNPEGERIFFTKKEPKSFHEEIAERRAKEAMADAWKSDQLVRKKLVPVSSPSRRSTPAAMRRSARTDCRRTAAANRPRFKEIVVRTPTENPFLAELPGEASTDTPQVEETPPPYKRATRFERAPRTQRVSRVQRAPRKPLVVESSPPQSPTRASVERLAKDAAEPTQASQKDSSAGGSEPELSILISPGGATLARDQDRLVFFTEAVLQNNSNEAYTVVAIIVTLRNDRGELLRSSILQGLGMKGPMFVLPQPGSRPSATSELAPKAQAIVYIPSFEFSVEHPPKELRLSVVSVPKSGGAPLESTRTISIQAPPAVPPLQFPVRGRWLALNGPSDLSPHRRATSSLGPEVKTSQRFAVDLIQYDPQALRQTGETSPILPGADASRLDSYICYGKPVKVAASGTVVRVVDSLPDQAIGSLDPKNLAGNHVVVQHGPKLFGCYAHLKPGSISVQEGDALEVGQVIGQIGNSGNTSMPHLHLHFTETEDVLSARAVAVNFQDIEIVGRDSRALGRGLFPRNGEVILAE